MAIMSYVTGDSFAREDDEKDDEKDDVKDGEWSNFFLFEGGRREG